MTEELVEKVHHIFGSSRAKIWPYCPGWASLMKRIPPQIAGEQAIKGTAYHSGVLERYFAAQIEYLNKGTKIDVKYDDIPNWPEDGPELAEAFWKAVWEGPLEQIITGKKIYIEKKVMLFADRDAGGTADIIIFYKNDKGQLVCIVGDLKTGYVRVEPKDEQLLFLLAATYLECKEKGAEIEVFKSFIYQPSHSKPFTEHTFGKNQILRAVKKYEKAIADSKKDKPKFKVGDYCRYCQAQAVCSKYNAHVSKEMDLAVGEKPLPVVESLPDEQLVRMWKAMPQLEKLLKALKQHVILRFFDGKPLEGLKLVEGKASARKWIDKENTVETLSSYGVDAYKEPELIGIGEAENGLKAVGKKGKEIDAILYTITVRPPTKLKVTTIDDPKPAVTLEGGAAQLLELDESEET